MSQRPATSEGLSPKKHEDKSGSRDYKCDCPERKNDWSQLTNDCRNRVWRSGNRAWSKGEKAWKAGRRAWTAGDKAWDRGEKVLNKIGGKLSVSCEKTEEQYSKAWTREEKFPKTTGEDYICKTKGCSGVKEDENEGQLRFSGDNVRETPVEECECDKKSDLGDRNVEPRYKPLSSREKFLNTTESDFCCNTLRCPGVKEDERKPQFRKKEDNADKPKEKCVCMRINEPDSRAWTHGEILREKSTKEPCFKSRLVVSKDENEEQTLINFVNIVDKPDGCCYCDGLRERNADPNFKTLASGVKFLDKIEKEYCCKTKRCPFGKKYEREKYILKKSEDRKRGRNIEQCSKCWDRGESLVNLTDRETCCKTKGCSAVRKIKRNQHIRLNGDNVCDKPDEEYHYDRKCGSGERNVEPRSKPWATGEKLVNNTEVDFCCCCRIREDEREHLVRVNEGNIVSKTTEECVCTRKNVSDGRKDNPYSNTWARTEKVLDQSQKEAFHNTSSCARKDERNTMRNYRVVNESERKRSEPKDYVTKKHNQTFSCAVKSAFKGVTGEFIKNLRIAERVGRETRKASKILENERKLRRNLIHEKSFELGERRDEACAHCMERERMSENREENRRKNWSSSAEYWAQNEAKSSRGKACSCG